MIELTFGVIAIVSTAALGVVSMLWDETKSWGRFTSKKGIPYQAPTVKGWSLVTLTLLSVIFAVLQLSENQSSHDTEEKASRERHKAVLESQEAAVALLSETATLLHETAVSDEPIDEMRVVLQFSNVDFLKSPAAPKFSLEINKQGRILVTAHASYNEKRDTSRPDLGLPPPLGSNGRPIIPPEDVDFESAIMGQLDGTVNFLGYEMPLQTGKVRESVAMTSYPDIDARPALVLDFDKEDIRLYQQSLSASLPGAELPSNTNRPPWPFQRVEDLRLANLNVTVPDKNLWRGLTRAVVIVNRTYLVELSPIQIQDTSSLPSMGVKDLATEIIRSSRVPFGKK